MKATQLMLVRYKSYNPEIRSLSSASITFKHEVKGLHSVKITVAEYNKLRALARLEGVQSEQHTNEAGTITTTTPLS